MKVAKKLDEIIQLLEEMNLLENALFASYIGQKDAYLTADILPLKGTGKGYMSVLIVRRGRKKETIA